MLTVIAGALIDPTGRVLVQKRAPHKHHGDLWEFPGGKVEPGESPTAALVREVKEELGISIREASLAPLGFAHGEDTPPRLLLLLYLVREWEGEPQPLDAPQIAWVPPEELRRLSMPPLDLALLGALDRVG